MFPADLFPDLSMPHLSILFLLGLALFGGTLGGKLFARMRIPQVVAYIVFGIILGKTGLNVVTEETLLMLQPFNYFALGLIGFMIGGELKTQTLARYGRQFLAILMAEGLITFFVVTGLVALVGALFIEQRGLVWALALLLGAIASATAPAATTDVLWEYKARGPLTTTILGIVALDDALSLMLFAVAASLASVLTGSGSGGILHLFTHPLVEIGGALATGALSGLILSLIIKKQSQEEKILALSLGAVLLVLGIAITLNIDVLMAAMALGVMIANITPRKSREIFSLVEKFTPPVYVLFFVLFGAKLNFGNVTTFLAGMVLVYLTGRTLGKMAGAALGARFSGAPAAVKKYLPFCLFSQAGVAIGLSILAGQRFPGEIGNIIVVIITTSTFFVQILGPPMVKMAIIRAGEAGKNFTEEDLIRRTRAKDIMDTQIPLIEENMPLRKVLAIVSEHPNLYYPVVDPNRKLIGIITIDNIKNTFITTGLHEFLLAHDLMESVAFTAEPDSLMVDVKAMMQDRQVDYCPVVSRNGRLEGFLESRSIQRLISRRIESIHSGEDRT